MTRPFSRRRFVSLGSLAFIGTSTSRADALSRYEREHATMGTRFRTIVYAADEATATKALSSVATRLDALNASLSDYLPDSEVSRLSSASGAGYWKTLHPDLHAVLTFGQAVAHASKGAFDMTVGPLTRLWHASRRHGKLPNEKRLKEALGATGYAHLEIDLERNRARLHCPDMRLDLGGIAKGYAVDQALLLLQEEGIDTALVDGGGDLRVIGIPPGTRGWSIASQDLLSDNSTETRTLTDTAVATSGDLYQSLKIDGREFSHLIDPQTGLGLEIRRTVSVTAPTGMEADALASALSVMPSGSARLFLNTHYPKASARILTQQPTGIEELRINSGAH